MLGSTSGFVGIGLVIFNLIIWACGQSPCPSIFRLVNSNVAGEKMGRIEIRNAPKNVALNIRIEMSVATLLPTEYLGDLDLATSQDEAVLAVNQGRALLYNLHFPIQNPIPSMTAIIFNGQRYCTGAPATGSRVTSIALEHTLYPPGVNTLSNNIPSTTINDFSNNFHMTNTDDFFKNHPSTNANDFFKSQPSMNVNDFFKNQPSTNVNDFFKNQPSTNVNDFFKNQPSTNANDFFKNQPSTNANDFFKNQPSTNANDFFKNQPSTNANDFFKNQPSTSVEDFFKNDDFFVNFPSTNVKDFSFSVPVPSGMTEIMNVSIGSNPTPMVKSVTTVPISIKLQAPTQRPRPVITTQRPRPITTTQRPRPVITTQRPRPVITTQRPRPVTTTQRPRPVITTQRPRPVITTQRPRPVITTQRPRPVITTQRPRPVTTTERPRPVTTTERPRPVTTTERPRPVTTTERPRPVIPVEQPQPVIPSEQPRPISPAEQPWPVLPVAQPQPVLPTEQPRPVLPTAPPTINPQNPFLNPPPVNIEKNCGRSGTVNHLIAFGQTTLPGQWPWIAALFLAEMRYKFLCGGSLISDRHVITAAHCKITDDGEMPASVFLVALGRYHLMEWREEGSMTFEVLEFRIHPGYRRKTSADSDIALIVLRETVEFTRKIQPLCLWSASATLDNIVGLNGFVVGWGTDENGNLHLHEPRLTQAAIVSQAHCRQSHVAFKDSTSNRTFCAGHRDGSGPCNGDSGSALVIRDNLTGRFHLRGVVSLSPSNGNSPICDLTQYVVFVDAAQYLDWIKIQINYS